MTWYQLDTIYNDLVRGLGQEIISTSRCERHGESPEPKFLQDSTHGATESPVTSVSFII